MHVDAIGTAVDLRDAQIDLIDELSILIAPIADGAIGTPSLFDARDGKGFGRFLKLISVESRAGDVLWLRYKRKRSSNGRRPS